MYSFTLSLTLALRGVISQHHASAALSLGKETHYPRYGRMDGCEKSAKKNSFTCIRSPDRPVCGGSLYRLTQPSSLLNVVYVYYNIFLNSLPSKLKHET